MDVTGVGRSRIGVVDGANAQPISMSAAIASTGIMTFRTPHCSAGMRQARMVRWPEVQVPALQLI